MTLDEIDAAIAAQEKVVRGLMAAAKEARDKAKIEQAVLSRLMDHRIASARSGRPVQVVEASEISSAEMVAAIRSEVSPA